jgi:hypothetical protein
VWAYHSPTIPVFICMLIDKERKQIDLKVKDLYWIIGRKTPASLESKVLLYKTIIKPIWTYGIEKWG